MTTHNHVLPYVLVIMMNGCATDTEDDPMPEPSPPPAAVDTNPAPVPMAPSTCLMPSARYSLSFTQTSGNCGPQASLIVDAASDPSMAVGRFPSQCQGKVVHAEGSCVFDVDASCVQPQTRGEQSFCTGCAPTVHLWRTHTEWAPTLQNATGLWTVTVQSEYYPSCSSSFSVQLTAL